MGISTEYRRGGRRVSEREFWRGLEDDARDAAEQAVRDRVERTRCSRHGQTARVTNVRRSGSSFTFEVIGCCDTLVQRAQRAAT